MKSKYSWQIFIVKVQTAKNCYETKVQRYSLRCNKGVIWGCDELKDNDTGDVMKQTVALPVRYLLALTGCLLWRHRQRTYQSDTVDWNGGNILTMLFLAGQYWKKNIDWSMIFRRTYFHLLTILLYSLIAVHYDCYTPEYNNQFYHTP